MFTFEQPNKRFPKKWVAVDNMYESSMGKFKTRSGRIYRMSHLIASDLPTLHAMADKIGVARRWFQDTLSGPH